MNYRLYSFVAGLYLNHLQKGLQTAHVVSEIYAGLNLRPDGAAYEASRLQLSFDDWATKDKTIIICDAGNHQGVVDCWAELVRTGIGTHLVTGAIFHEDAQSMNGMATACGVIVPEKYWGAVFESYTENGLEDRWVYGERNDQGVVTKLHTYSPLYPEGQFIAHIKKYRLTSA